tara:strand:+ start:6729 stop:12938 length:6210 start_codon:yes stop_codon:yes gene_type:complete
MPEEDPQAEESAAPLTREQRADAAYKRNQEKALPAWEAVQRGESRRPAPGPDLKAMNAAHDAAMKRNRVKSIVREKGYVQDRHLKNYNHQAGTDYDYETFFEAVGKGEITGEKKPTKRSWTHGGTTDLGELANKVAFFEVQKQFGIVPPEQASVQAWHALQKNKKKTDKTFDLTPKEGQASQVYGGSYKDWEGKEHKFTADRLMDEDGLQRRIRKGKSAMGAGTAEAVLGGIDLSDDMRSAFTNEETGSVFIPLYRTVQGDVGFDVYTAIVDLQQHYLNEALLKARGKGRGLSDKAVDTLHAKARKRAEDEVGKTMSQGTGVFFVNSDPQGTTEDIINNPTWLGGRLLSPVRATFAGAETHDAAWNQHYKQMEGQGRLEYLANIALSTAVGAAIKAGGWGTPEHIKIIREGYDITDDFGKIAKLMTPKFLEREQIGTAAAEVTLGVAAMIPMLLVDPDLTYLIGPVSGGIGTAGGKAAKIARLGKVLGVGADATRLNASRRMLAPILRMAPDEITPEVWMKFSADLKAIDPDSYYVLEGLLKAQEGTRGMSGNSVTEGLKRARSKLGKLDNEYARTEESLRLAKTKAEKARAQAALKKADFHRAGARWEVIREDLAQAEATLIDLLSKVDHKKFDTLARGPESLVEKQNHIKFLREQVAKLGGPAAYKRVLDDAMAAPKKAHEAHRKLLASLQSSHGEKSVHAVSEIRSFLKGVSQEDLLRVISEATTDAAYARKIVKSKGKTKFPERGLDFKWNEKAHGLWASRKGKDVAYLRLKSEPRIKDLIPISQRPSELASLYKKHGDAPVEKVWMVGVDYSLRKKGLGTELYERAIQTMQKKHPKGFYLIPSSFGKLGEGSTVHAAEEIWKKLAKKYPSAGNAIYIGPQKASKKISSDRAFIEALPHKFREAFQSQATLSPSQFRRYLKSRQAVIEGGRKRMKIESELYPLLLQATKAKQLLAQLRGPSKLLDEAARSDIAAGKRMIDAEVDEVMDASYLKKVEAAREEALKGGGVNVKRVVQEYSDSIKVMADNLTSATKLDATINPMAVAISKTGRGLKGEILFDPAKFETALRAKYGDELVTEFLDEAADGTSVTAKEFAATIRSPSKGPVKVTVDEQAILRGGLDELELKATSFVPREAVLGKNLLDASTAVVAGKRGTKKLFKRAAEEAKRSGETFRFWEVGEGALAQRLGFDLRQKARAMAKGMDPAYRKFGNLGKAMAKVHKQAMEVAGALQQEYSMLLKGLRGNALKEASLAYLEGTASILLRGGNFKHTTMNTGDLSLVEQAYRHILSTPVIKKMLDMEAEEWGAAAAKAGEEAEGYKVPKALKAIARAWLPNAEKTDPAVAFMLEQKAAKFIADQIAEGAIDFSKLMDDMAIWTKTKFPNKPLDFPEKAWHYATQGIIDGAVMDKAAEMAATAWRPMPQKLADDFNNLLKDNFEDIDNIEETFKALAEYGAPILGRHLKDMEAAGTVVADLVKLSKNGGGEDIFVPTALYAKLNELSGTIVKELEAVNQKMPGSPPGKLAQRLSQFMQLFRTSVTTGLIIPNPRYWVNNVMGDFSQIWLEHGLGTAARLSFQNLPTNLPFGREMHNAITKIGESLEGRPFLGSMYNSIINPQLNKVFTAPPGTIIRLGDGSSVKVEVLRKMAAEDGMLDTFVAETLLRGLKDEVAKFDNALNWMTETPGNLKKFMTRRQESLAKHATFVQQRQRMALYLDLMSKGASRQQAKKGVLNALYDWKAPLYKMERTFLAQTFTFYRFYKLASKQWLRASFDALSGNTKALRRARQMQKFTDMGQAAAYHAEGEGDEWTARTPGEAYDAQLRDVPFWWQQARPTAWAGRIDDEGIQQWLRDHGYDYTYQKILLPPFTPLDMANMWLGVAQMMLTVPGAMATGAKVPEGEFGRLILDPIGALLAPGLAPAFEKSMKDLWGGTQYVGGGRMYLKAGESEALQQLNVMDIKRDDRGRAYVDGEERMGLTLARIVPFLGTQLPQFWAAVDNPLWQKSAPSGMKFMLAKLMGVAPRYQNPERDLSFGVRERKLSLEKKRRSAEERTRQQIWQQYQKRKKQEKK